MDLQIREQTVADFEDYAQVPMVLTVGSRYRTELIDEGLVGWSLIEETVDPYRKDIDEIDPATSWLKLDGVSNWSVFAAYDGQDRVGGAVVAWNSPTLHMLEARTDLAVLWDLRVRCEYRRLGVGSRLFDRCAEWARRKGCNRLKIETQDINVPACRFYASKGCELRGIHHRIYPDYPTDVQLLWYIDL